MSLLDRYITPELRALFQRIGYDDLTPELVKDLWRDFSKKQQREFTKVAPLLERLFAPTVEEIEAEGPLAWVKRFYSQTFTREFTNYQKAFWQWGWDIQPDTYYRPRVECAPRGAGKSTTAETWVVSLLARKRRSTIGYISGTDVLATRHFNGVKHKLENSDLLKAYPHLKPQVQKYRSAFASWSQDRIVTEAGQVIIPIALQGSNRGFKSDDDIRFDCFVFDDIDSLGESPDVIAKNIDIVKSEILLAGYANTLNAVFQNLIHRDSIVSQVLDQRADMLSDRVFCGPYPLMKWYDAEKVPLPDGGERWTITAGEAYDEALPIPYCESILNQVGRDLFDREAQQEVNKVGEDKDFREWDEVYHIITQSEMAAGFPNLKLKTDYDFKLPQRWHVGRGLDWGTTRAHPSVNAYVCRPDKTCPHDDAHFVIGEVVMPVFPYDPSIAAEVVSPGRVAQGAKVFQQQLGILASQIEQSKMSHEASAALNTMVVDLPDDLKTFYRKWKAQKGSGVPQLQNMLEIDREKPHPFRRYPLGTILKHKDGTVEDVGGKPLMGRPRIYFVVADGQGELYLDGDGKVRVRGATDAGGLARCRYEMPLYSHRNQGQKKLNDDFVDALRGLMSTFGVAADQLTESEHVAAQTPDKYTYEALLARSPLPHGLTPELEITYNYQQAQAKQRAQAAMQSLTTFDEWGNVQQEDFVEHLW